MSMLPLDITEEALEQLKLAQKVHQHHESKYVRIGVKGGGGCGGVSNFVALDALSDKDTLYKTGEVEFIIEKPHVMYLVGLTLDFVNTEFERGFIFVTKDS